MAQLSADSAVNPHSSRSHGAGPSTLTQPSSSQALNQLGAPHNSRNGPIDPRNLSIMPSHPAPGQYQHHPHAHHPYSESSAPLRPHTSDAYGHGGILAYPSHPPYDDAALAHNFAGLSHQDSFSRSEDDHIDDDESDDVSTSSGRRHGNLLQPEPEDYIVTEVSTMIQRPINLSRSSLLSPLVPLHDTLVFQTPSHLR